MMQKKTSKEWLELVPKKHKLEILDYDGWNRNSLEYSFEKEKITKDEFMERLANSTIHCIDIIGLFGLEL